MENIWIAIIGVVVAVLSNAIWSTWIVRGEIDKVDKRSIERLAAFKDKFYLDTGESFKAFRQGLTENKDLVRQLELYTRDHFVKNETLVEAVAMLRAEGQQRLILLEKINTDLVSLMVQVAAIKARRVKRDENENGN